jgi:uncharacterized Zn finger protein
MALSKILTTNRVRRWADSRSYGRGEDYFHGEHVSDLNAVKGRITATVYGTYPYRVMLWDEGDNVGYDCDCPMGQGGDFCKHCVATDWPGWRNGRRQEKQARERPIRA